jgi:hypothetical protein
MKFCIRIRCPASSCACATHYFRQIRSSALPAAGAELSRVPLADIRARAQLDGEFVRASRDLARASGLSGSGLVLLNDAGRDAPAFADRDARVFRPRPDIAAALPA